MDEYVCITIRSRPEETVDAFNKRLIDFWSVMLRGKKAEYEGVYAETTKFSSVDDRMSRQYMVAADVADVLADQLSSARIDHDPIDRDDLYSKYEATPPEWFQIPH
jgi:hypothetical protein